MSEPVDSHSVSQLLLLLEIRVDKCVGDSKLVLITTITNSGGQRENWQITKGTTVPQPNDCASEVFVVAHDPLSCSC